MRNLQHACRISTLAILFAVVSGARSAGAQEWSPDGKGVAGGALLATELTIITETAAGVEPLWAYVLGGTLAAAAGGIAGRAVETDAEPEASGWLLGAGLGFLIPTVIWVGNAHQPKVRSESAPRREARAPGLFRGASAARAPVSRAGTRIATGTTPVQIPLVWGSF